MRTIKVESWKAPGQDGKEVEENLLLALNSILTMRRFEEIPKGIEDFRTMQRIVKSFDSAETSGNLVLEEKEFAYLKGLVENHIPSTWAFNSNLSRVMDDFLNAKEEDKK